MRYTAGGRGGEQKRHALGGTRWSVAVMQIARGTWRGEARSEKMGSVRKVTPSIWTSSVEWPTHMQRTPSAGGDAIAEPSTSRAANLSRMSAGVAPGLSSSHPPAVSENMRLADAVVLPCGGGLSPGSKRTFQSSRNPGIRKPSHGFWNRGPLHTGLGMRCDLPGTTASSAPFMEEFPLEVLHESDFSIVLEKIFVQERSWQLARPRPHAGLAGRPFASDSLVDTAAAFSNNFRWRMGSARRMS